MSLDGPMDGFSERQLERLTTAIGLVHRAPTVQDALGALTRLSRDLVPCARAEAWLAPSSTNAHALYAASAEDATQPAQEAVPLAPWAHGRCTKAPIRLTRAQAIALLEDTEKATDRQTIPHDGCLAVALIGTSGEPLGTLQLSGSVHANFTAADELFLVHFVRLAAQALESVRLRAQVSEQEQRLRVALEAANLGTWEHIPATQATHWDARSKAMFGFAADEPLDFEDYRRALHPDDVETVFAGIAKATDPDGHGECSLEYRIRARDGVERWVEAHGRCAFDEARRPLRINGTLLDISARKKSEDALRESNRRKDEFLAVLGHELRNPLAPIRTAVELMRQRLPQHGGREREVIERQLRHVMRLVDDLLDISRIARGTVILRKEPLELDSVVTRAVEMASPLLEERAHYLHVDVPHTLCIEGDAVRLAQVLANLLTNAAKYTAPSGKISVSAFARAHEVILEVQDNGMGISAGDLDTIFEPFVQTASQQERQGLGLGLSLVRDLVRLHGGRVEAHSEGLGQGSLFRVILPLSTTSVAEGRSEAAPASPAASSRRILLVDDNADAAELLGMFLEARGHKVRIAYDGPEALEQAQHFAPDIAILDLALPVMDGFELAERLRASFGGSLRLIALTGYGQPKDRARTRSAGFDVHLVKPVGTEDLEEALLP